jgi:branched-chain amino acid transport system permease protein
MDVIIEFLGLQDVNISQQLVNALWAGSLYSLFALGYALIFSVLGVLNLSHSAVFMWGAMLGMTAVCKTDISADGRCEQLQASIWLTIPIAMIAGGIISVLVDRVAFYPLRQRNAPRFAQLISSIGVAIILVNLAQIQFGAAPKVYPGDALPNDPIKNLPYDVILTRIQILIFVIAFVIMLLLGVIVARTPLGKRLRAVAFSQQISGLLGVNVDRIYMIAFFISGALAGAGGALYSWAFKADPFMGDTLALKGLTVIVLGGLGSIRGAVIGGFLVGIIEVYAVAIGYSDLREVFVFTLFFVVVLARPQGLLGQPITDRT